MKNLIANVVYILKNCSKGAGKVEDCPRATRKMGPLGVLAAVVLSTALLLSVTLAATAEPAAAGGGRPRGVVMVVAPLGDAEQQLLSRSVPMCRKVTACSRGVYPWWLQGRAGACECRSALDHSLRQLARWAREERGMPTAVVTALNPNDAEAEPIVLTISAPDVNKIDMEREKNDVMFEEADYLRYMTGGRKLLWDTQEDPFEDDNESEFDSDPLHLQDDIVGNEASKAATTAIVEKERSTTVSTFSQDAGEVDLAVTSNPLSNASETKKSSVEQTDSTSKTTSIKTSEQLIRAEEKVTTEQDTVKTDESQWKKNQTAGGKGKRPPSHKCSHCAGGLGGCERGAKDGKSNATRPAVDSDDFDLSSLNISSQELQNLMFRLWLRALAPTLLSRHRPVELPLELPLRLTTGLPRELTANVGEAEAEAAGPPVRPRVRTQLQKLRHRAETALHSAVRKADRMLGQLGLGRDTALIVRSLAPLTADALTALLDDQGLSLKSSDEPSGADKSDVTAEPRLLIVINGCPSSYDRTLDMYAQGPGAARLQSVTSLEALVHGLQSIVRPKSKSNEAASGGMEELTAVEAPKEKRGERRVRMHVARVRGERCGDRKCFLPAKRALRRGKSEEREPRLHRLPEDKGKTVNSDPFEDRKEIPILQESLKKKRHSPNNSWGHLDEIRRPRGASISSSAEPASALLATAVTKDRVEQTEITAGDKESKILEIEKKSGEVPDLSDIKEKDDVRSKQKRDIHPENQTAQKTLTSDETTQEPVGKSASGTERERDGVVDVPSTNKISAPKIATNPGKMKVATDENENKDKGANRPEETTTATNETVGRATEKTKETKIIIDASKIEERGTKNVTAGNYNQRSKPTSVDNKILQIARDASGKVISSTVMAGSTAKLFRYGVHHDEEQQRAVRANDPETPDTVSQDNTNTQGGGSHDPPPPGQQDGNKNGTAGGNTPTSSTSSSTTKPKEDEGGGAGGAPSSPALALALSITLLLLLHR